MPGASPAKARACRPGLSATQLALAREHRLASIGALATAAAHELGTPLGTIAVVARELERALPPDSPEAEDVRLLRAQAERCRMILMRLARPEESDAGRRRAPAARRIARRHRRRLSRRAISTSSSSPPDPRRRRRAQGLARAGIAARAGQHHRQRRRFRRSPGAHRGPLERGRPAGCAVEDDGPGFAPEISSGSASPMSPRARAATPWARPSLRPSDAFTGQQGMGLGFFIAKTLIEQTGGSVRARNLQAAVPGWRFAGRAAPSMANANRDRQWSLNPEFRMVALALGARRRYWPAREVP